MGKAIPTIGCPSRTAAVIMLRNQRYTTSQIADRIGIEKKTVIALEHSAGRQRQPRQSEQMGRTVVFPTDILDALKPHAERRSLSVNALARLIVETVADDDMVDAVLDDGETEQ